jgi:hypothetical protein
LAKSAIAEAEAAASEVAAMPAGPHELLGPTRQAIERRACFLLAHLEEPGNETTIKTAHPNPGPATPTLPSPPHAGEGRVGVGNRVL